MFLDSAPQQKPSTIAKIREMYSKGHVYSVAKTRWDYIRADKMVLNYRPTEHKPTKTMKLAEKKFWRKTIPKAIYDEICIQNLVVWKYRKERIRVVGDEVREKKYGKSASEYVEVVVPYILDPDIYTYSVVRDDDNRKILTNIKVHGKDDDEVYYHFTNNGGPCPNGKIISECAAILEEYENLQKLRKDADDVRTRNKDPWTYIEHVQPNEYSTSKEVIDQMEKFLSSTKNEAGHKVYNKGVIEENAVTRTRVIPMMFRLAATQPQLAAPINVDEAKGDFLMLIHDIFKVPNLHMDKSGSGELGSRSSEHTLGEERARLIKCLNDLVDEIVTVLEMMYEHVYGETNVPIHLPYDTMMDFRMVHEMYELGYFDDEEAKTQAVRYTGISRDRMTSQPLVKRIRDHDHREHQEHAKKVKPSSD